MTMRAIFFVGLKIKSNVKSSSLRSQFRESRKSNYQFL